MYVSKSDWSAFVRKLAKINETAADAVRDYIEQNGFGDAKALVNYCYEIAQQYGTASATLSALMYDTIAELEGAICPPAELAANPSFGDVAKTVYGTLKTSINPEEIAGSIARLVKRTGQDTMLNNAIRDHAEYAWIPSGDTCAFCIMLASNGWQTASEKALKGGHASHIHANCDCTYMVRHSESLNVRGYNPDKYLEMYNSADGSGWRDKVNAMRRADYAKNADEINEQKREAYALRMRPKTEVNAE